MGFGQMPGPPVAPEANASSTGKRRQRVAVVEDNRPLADSLCLLLDLLGYETRVAYTGPDGLRLAAEWHPDAVITDIGLPGCDGFEVTRTVRRDAADKQPVVVAVTAYGTEVFRQRARQAGADHFFVKPVDPAALVGAITGESSRHSGDQDASPCPGSGL